jgi:hypothetical protein
MSGPVKAAKAVLSTAQASPRPGAEAIAPNRSRERRARRRESLVYVFRPARATSERKAWLKTEC